jgi:hypothetical protein
MATLRFPAGSGMEKKVGAAREAARHAAAAEGVHRAPWLARKESDEALLLFAPADIVRCEHGRRVWIEAAALFHADALEVACCRIVGRLRELGIAGVLPQSILKEARSPRQGRPSGTSPASKPA